MEKGSTKSTLSARIPTLALRSVMKEDLITGKSTSSIQVPTFFEYQKLVNSVEQAGNIAVTPLKWAEDNESFLNNANAVLQQVESLGPSPHGIALEQACSGLRALLGVKIHRNNVLLSAK